MFKYFDINEKGFSIRCKLYYNKDMHNHTDVVISTYGFGGTKDNKAVEKFAENNVIELYPVENADHPFSNPGYMDYAIQKIIDFFKA